jgi:signal transduction histidine kinase
MGHQQSNRSRFAGLVRSIGLHEHHCFVYETQKQQFSAAVPFMQTGLERGEKCLYVAADHKDSEAFVAAMRAQGLTVDESIKKGSLTFVHSTDPQLKGIVNPNGMTRFLFRVVSEARASGFPALRIIGEMTWALHVPNTTKFLFEFEAEVNNLFRDHDCLAICQYNRKLFPPEVILGVLRTHPTAIYGNFVSRNPYFVPPEELLQQRQGKQEVQRLLKNIRAYESTDRGRRRAEEEVRRLSGRILQVQDEERRSIASNLHDSTGQDLVALSTMLGQLRTAIPSSTMRLRKRASECQRLADRCVREVRTLSYLLYPPMLDKTGLEDAIEDYAEGFTKRSGIQVDLELSPNVGRMPRETELALFRVVQESLTNIQRHSGSSLAKIVIESGTENVRLEVRDRGRGIARARRKQTETLPVGLGVGIPSMRERVKQIGGSLEIQSSNQGTTVLATIPRMNGRNE